MRLLIVEDDRLTRSAMKSILEPFGPVLECESAQDAMSRLQFEVAFVDLDLEAPRAGMKVVQNFASKGKYIVVITGHQSDDLVREAYQKGCQDYICKPVSRGKLEESIQRYKSSQKVSGFIRLCESQKIEIDHDPALVITSEIPLLLRGETGTGKTYFAKLIHKHSSSGPFIHLNCSEISENLIESELFGHEIGAFSGAIKSRKGKISQADGGTLFLDEIGTMSLKMQCKLLRVLDQKRYVPVGSNREECCDFRIITATCDPLEEMIATGDFRKDFFYRISGLTVQMSPLRNQNIKEKIESYMGQRFRRIYIEDEAMKKIESYSWPGNMRELKMFFERLDGMRVGILTIKIVDTLLLSYKSVEKNDLDLVYEHGLKPYIEGCKREMVKKVMQKQNGAVRESLKILKISNAMYYKIIEGRKS